MSVDDNEESEEENDALQEGRKEAAGKDSDREEHAEDEDLEGVGE
jgi:hypothetical protein